jgi:hypothetical protein
MRRLCLSALVLLLPDAATARCVPFDFFDALEEIPIVVHGLVTDSDKERLLSAQCNPAPCRHQFSVDVVEVLKGETTEPKLEFQHEYVAQRPEIAIFDEGEEYVFAVSAIRANGQAELFGTTCGRSGVGTEYLGKVKQALKRP